MRRLASLRRGYRESSIALAPANAVRAPALATNAGATTSPGSRPPQRGRGTASARSRPGGNMGLLGHSGPPQRLGLIQKKADARDPAVTKVEDRSKLPVNPHAAALSEPPIATKREHAIPDVTVLPSDRLKFLPAFVEHRIKAFKALA